MGLEEFVYNPERNLAYAYQEAYEKLIREVPVKGVRTELNGGG